MLPDGVDAEAYGYRISVTLRIAAIMESRSVLISLLFSNAQRRYEVDKTFGVCGNFLDALLRRRRNQGNDIYLMAARNIV